MKIRESITLFLKGVAMGGADVVPGVSGGTIAFITGIYEELLDSIQALDLQSLGLLKTLKFKEFWKHINGNFLITLFAGIFISLFSLVRLISYLMVHEPIALWSFFFGLILASAILVFRQIRKCNVGVVLATIAGTVIAFYITTFAPAETDNNLIYIFLSGMLASCAMILPGISGSFILLILGKYEYIINAVKYFKIDVILVFSAGCALGLIAFSRVISWVLHRFHNVAIAVLSGFMIGSLNKIWPWKEVIEYRINSLGEQVALYDRSVLPNQYLDITGNNSQFLYALLFAALGIFIVVAFERTASWIRPSK